MLGPAERIVFVLLAIVCGGLAVRGFLRIARIVRLGQAAQRTDGLAGRLITALVDVVLQRTIATARPLVSLAHGLVFFGFSFYILVNINDLFEAFVDGWTTIGAGPVAGTFNLLADLFSVLILGGMLSLLVRRFMAKPKTLEFNSSVLLAPGAAGGGVRRDSLIVGIFILIHVGARWLGTAFHLAHNGHGDPWLPTASVISQAFVGMSPNALELATHVCWWLAMGLIVAFLPYFPHSKHLHLIVAPLNLALHKSSPRGELDAVTNASSPGAQTLTDLAWPSLLDSYACIMCNRCQEVCPAHESGTPLSPAALEINKRYWLNANSSSLAAGGESPMLLDFAASSEAVWSCMTCYACVEICPVGNAPMFDLVEMRRSIIFDGNTPDDLAEVLRSLDEKGNSFGQSARRRAKWTRGLDFKIPDARKQPVEYLWYVGDFASYDPQCQEISRTVARILHAAGIDFGILYEGEKSAGNDVRRIGEEGLFDSLTEQNVETLAACEFERIFTTDPHTFNALKNEYGDGVSVPVEHYTTLLLRLLESGDIELKGSGGGKATYHDPCFLGRYNGGFDAPRALIEACGTRLIEMPRNREQSFCCGAGGGQIWMKDDGSMTERPSESRIREALALGPLDYFVVSCPKDLTMYRDAVRSTGNEGKIEVRDIIEFVADAMGLNDEPDPEVVGDALAEEPGNDQLGLR